MLMTLMIAFMAVLAVSDLALYFTARRLRAELDAARDCAEVHEALIGDLLVRVGDLDGKTALADDDGDETPPTECVVQ